MKFVVGIDEAGEKAWEAFARGCQLFLNRNSDNLNSSCKEDVHILECEYD